MREEDDKKQVDGLPSVPKEWETMLLTSTPNGKIVSVMKSDRARVDFGYRSGAWKGMELARVDCEGLRWVTVTAVHATDCVIESSDPATVFKLGDRISSRNPDLTVHLPLEKLD